MLLTLPFRIPFVTVVVVYFLGVVGLLSCKPQERYELLCMWCPWKAKASECRRKENGKPTSRIRGLQHWHRRRAHLVVDATSTS